MFSTVRYFIKTSIGFLLIGVLTGLYMTLAQEVFNWPYGPELVSAHTHVILVGSVMMMIMGVALWFFPRPPADDPRYRPDLIRATYWVMTVGTALRFISGCVASVSDLSIASAGTVAGSLLQVAGMLLFFYSIWGRIRPLGSALREEKGEKF